MSKMCEVWVRQCSFNNPKSDPVAQSLKPDNQPIEIIQSFFKPLVAYCCSLRTEDDEMIYPPHSRVKVSDLLSRGCGTKNHPLRLFAPSKL